MKIDIKRMAHVELRLRLMAQDLEDHFGVEFTVTSLFRPGDRGVHGTLPVRGLDLRCRDKGLGVAAEKFINKKHSYDSERPKLKCCIYHDSGNGWHLHLQTHPNTKVLST